MFKKLLFIFTLIAVLSGFSIPSKVTKKADKAISKFYETTDFTKQDILVSEVLNTKTKTDFSQGRLFEISSNEVFLGYGYLGNAPSKTATYDYLILFDKNFVIAKSKVLIYREEYGGEISSSRWLKQFTGTVIGGNTLVYNDDIIPISGATISVQSMTLAINNLLSSLQQLQKQNVL